MSLKNRLRKLLPESLRRAYRNAKLVFTHDAEFLAKRLAYVEKNLQGLAKHELNSDFPGLVQTEQPKAEINKQEFKVYSQYGEDGILLYLFSLLGATNRTFVEFGVNDGRECLSANLSLNFGWRGLLIEGDKPAFTRAKNFYKSMLTGPAADAVKIASAMVTAENINNLLTKNGINGEIDLLSVDIDGNDFWVWKAITAVNPRVVVIEYNGILGKTEARTITYQPNFDRFGTFTAGYYYGASLPALVKLGQSKGYAFVGCESNGGVNAFFVRQDVAQGKIQPLTAEQGYYPQVRRGNEADMSALFAQIKHLPFESV